MLGFGVGEFLLCLFGDVGVDFGVGEHVVPLCFGDECECDVDGVPAFAE